ncbi:MAG TPA: C-type lectin domain-containing protein [Candidatus Acidoferrum sp.]|jgi:hypothetical protein|nr:C-type lectin domain-containing protein [Candidatus Acidoferrum sp.]
MGDHETPGTTREILRDKNGERLGIYETENNRREVARWLESNEFVRQGGSLMRELTRETWLALLLCPILSAMALPGPLSSTLVNPNNNHSYILLSNADWTDSEAEAVSLGGHLATVRSHEEQDWIFNTFGSYGGQQRLLWIGLNDTNQLLDFMWVSGEPLIYTNWASGEPNNAGGVERYVAMYYPNFNQPGTWNDWSDLTLDPAGNPFNGVVEIVPAVPGALTPLVFNTNNHHAYLLLTNANWTDSEAEAVSLGGHLATVRSQEEQDWIFNTFGSYGGQQRLLWIGLNDTNQLLDFMWVSGEPLIYTNWASGEPNNAGGVERYVAMYYPNFNQPGTWNDWSDVSQDPIGLPFNGVVEIIPVLSAPRLAAGILQFSWPMAMPNGVLEASSNLSQPFSSLNYSRITNTGNGTFSVTVPVAARQMFFRLRP